MIIVRAPYRINKGDFSKGHTSWNKGRVGVYSNESLARIITAQQRRRLSEGGAETKDIVRVYQSGCSCSQVAKALNTTYSTVWRRLKPLGILRDKGSGNRGKLFTKEHRQAISAGQKRLRNNPVEKERLCNGINNPFYGRHHKPETIKAMKEKLSILLSGESNPQWLGGLSFEPYGLEFNNELKDEIRKRDGHQCQICGIPEMELTYKLIVHHIDYNKQNNSSLNLTSLCRPCHMKTNFGRENWMSYFQAKEVKQPYDYCKSSIQG